MFSSVQRIQRLVVDTRIDARTNKPINHKDKVRKHRRRGASKVCDKCRKKVLKCVARAVILGIPPRT